MNIFAKIFDKFNPPNSGEAEHISIIKELRLNPDKIFMGTKVNSLIPENKLNLVPRGNTLWAGEAESGYSSILFHVLTRPQDLIIIVNPTTRTPHFSVLTGLKRVLPIINGEISSVEVIINFLYREVLARREQGYKCPHDIIVVMEDQHLVNQALLNQTNILHSSQSFLKLKELLTVGPRYDIYFHGFYKDISAPTMLPDHLLPLYDYRNGFALSAGDAQKLNLMIPAPAGTQPWHYGYNQQSELLAFPFPSIIEGSNLAKELIKEELMAKKDLTPSGLLTAPPKILARLKTENNLLFNRYSLFKNNKYLPEKYQHLIGVPVEDLAFWDFINKGPDLVRK